MYDVGESVVMGPWRAAAEARWRDEKTFTMEMEDRVKELTTSLQAATDAGQRERSAAARKVSEANVKVARLMGDLAGGGRVGLSPPPLSLCWSGLDCRPPPSLCTGLCANQVYTGMVT